MQSVTNGGRVVVPVSSSDAISNNFKGNMSAQSGLAGRIPADADIGAILNGIAASFQPSLSAPVTRLPLPFSATAPVSPSPTPSPSAPKAPNADWPYPDLGPHPFMSSPSGSGPNGRFGFNSTYFPTLATSKAIAQMLGGKVVPQNAILSAPGSHFTQNQPNYMIELPNGNIINPGPIAQAIHLRQSRTMIDAIIDSEVNNTLVDVGHAPVFVPVNSPPAASPSPSRPASPALDGSAFGGTAADYAAGSLRLQMERILVMFQLLRSR